MYKCHNANFHSQSLLSFWNGSTEIKSQTKLYEYSNPGISQTNRKIYGKRMTPKKKTASVLALYEVYTNHRYDKQQKSTIFHIPSYKEEFQVK